MSRFTFSFDDEVTSVDDATTERPTRGRGPLRVLTVCTGNIARSALAEGLIREGAARAGDAVAVSSAGTAAMVGAGATAEMQELGRAMDVDLAAHRARQLTAAMILESDLVLTATREQRAAAVQLAPEARPRILTLVEFARSAAAARGDEPRTPFDRAFVERVIRVRPTLMPLLVPGDDDIVDPYREPIAVNRAVASRIAAAVTDALGIDAGPAAFR